MKIKYRRIKLALANKIRLDLVNNIIEEYLSQGYKLTLRQLYYQLVSRDVIPNNPREYAKLSILLREGRMGGIVDWEAIEDRVRVPDIPPSWDKPADIIQSAENSYAVPRMEGQKCYVEVFVEKDALSGVLKRVTRPYHIPITVNRGYSSATAMHDTFVRMYENVFIRKNPANNVKILYVGDFDPSGLDMIRDVEDRITDFMVGSGFNCDLEIVPVALTAEQIEKYNPPPNPAKKSDPRAKDFIMKYGHSSWEVDALKPEVLHQTLDNEIRKHIDINQYNKMLNKEKKDKKILTRLVNEMSDKDSPIWELL